MQFIHEVNAELSQFFCLAESERDIHIHHCEGGDRMRDLAPFRAVADRGGGTYLQLGGQDILHAAGGSA